MRNAHKLTLILTAAAALAACNKPASDNNVAIDINNAAPGDIEQLPPDESVDTSSNELINGADNADVNELNNSASAY